MKRARRNQDNNLSFLDVISCSFGAIILLILISKPADGPPIEDLSLEIEALKEALVKITSIREALAEEEDKTEKKLQAQRQQLIEDKESLQEAKRAQAGAEAQTLIAGTLKAALQRLNEEMKRLDLKPSEPDVIGGIPADSEYLIFIIDTSGSMKRYVWERAKKQMVELLDAYPKVRGIQIMNDMGEYMFSGYRRRWIPDTPSRREIILKRFDSWSSYSNSSPVEGILEAIERFRMKSDKISLYVLGDEFTGQSLQTVIDTVEKLNYQDGERQVRIHAIGFFPRAVVAQFPDYAHTTTRYAALMRELTRRNGGSFLGVLVN